MAPLQTPITRKEPSGSPTPAVTLNQLPADSSIWGPLSIAFDASGDLWIANGNYNVAGPNTVVMFSASELVASGDPTLRSS